MIPLFRDFIQKHKLTNEQIAHVLKKLIILQVDKKSREHSDKLIALTNSENVKTYFDAL